MDPGSPLAAHLRRRRDLDGNSSTPGTRSGAGDASAAGAVLQSAGLELSNSGSRSHAGAAARPSGAGGEYNPKDKSLPTSMHGGVGGPFGVPQEGGAGADGGSPKIGAYHHNPVGSITKHFFMANYNMDSDAASEAASAASKSLDDKSSVSTQPLIPHRHFIRTHAYIQALTLLLLVGLSVFGVMSNPVLAQGINQGALLGFSLYNVTNAILLLKAYYAVVVYILVPLGVIFFSFGAGCAIKGVFAVVAGGTSPMDRNSQNYSAVKTPIPAGSKLPQIVVQMPVYKESLDEVIKLSFFNVKEAMDYYVSKGGSAKFIICDDGFQVIKQEEQWARAAFYEKQGIAFVARPPLGRRGVFKKASNLNYQLAVTDRVCALTADGLTPTQALMKVWEERDREFVAAGDLTMDDDCLILLIDADTKVPKHCMHDVVGEFIVSPEVAYTQHYTTPFDEQCRNYWEQHISAFTRIIYFQGIAMSVAFGDCAPLVGHNAFLRWESVRKVGYSDSFCRKGETKYWSECSVSEDFDLYIRLASSNMFGRYVMYTGPDFQEGVSLTFMDEVIKFKKFAYGSCEMLFNPFKLWLTKGPFNAIFISYIINKHIAWYQKVSLLTYLSSYLAMATAFWYVLFEGTMSVVDPKFHDYFSQRAFDVMLTSLVIFGGIGTICGGIIFQWRRNGAYRKANMFQIIWTQVKWLPTTIIFFSCVLFHMTEVCAIYFLGLPVVWGATSKETTNISCWRALRDTLWGYKWEYAVYCIVLSVYSYFNWSYNIGLYRSWAVFSYCIGHMLGPILLNPAIMSLSY